MKDGQISLSEDLDSNEPIAFSDFGDTLSGTPDSPLAECKTSSCLSQSAPSTRGGTEEQ